MPRERLTEDERAERRLIRRLNDDAKRAELLFNRIEAAEAMISELRREGKTIFYLYPVGGKYREGSRQELIGFLLRNKYA